MFHKEGHFIIFSTLLVVIILNTLVNLYFPIGMWGMIALTSFLLIIVLQFFRNPARVIPTFDNQKVYAPADGKVVVIEEAQEEEYLKDKRIQVSIFMSPLNVHVNRNSIGGKIAYYKYHAGKFLMAWNPKSSTENERTTVVIDNGKHKVLLRQIAGFLARRIVNYSKVGNEVKQGSEMGFIKFGSRVDVFLPIGSKVLVNIDDKVTGNETLIAELP